MALGSSYPAVKVSFMQSSLGREAQNTLQFSHVNFARITSRYHNITFNQSLQSNSSASMTEFNAQLSQHYGIMAARLCGIDPSIVEKAECLLPRIVVKELHCESGWRGGR